MDITLSEEQRLLRESVDRFVTETYTPELRRSTASEPLGFNQGIWKQFADLGWLAMPIAEAYRGLSGGAIETGILMEAFGRGLATEPYLSTVVIGASLIGSCGSDARRQSLLPQIAEGALRLAFAHCERAARFELSRVDTTARRTAEGWRLDGSKIAVLDGGAADQIIRLGPRSRCGRLARRIVTIPRSRQGGWPQLAGLSAIGRRTRLQS